MHLTSSCVLFPQRMSEEIWISSAWKLVSLLFSNNSSTVLCLMMLTFWQDKYTQAAEDDELEVLHLFRLFLFCQTCVLLSLFGDHDLTRTHLWRPNVKMTIYHWHSIISSQLTNLKLFHFPKMYHFFIDLSITSYFFSPLSSIYIST